jgi:hypothetical protein
MSAVRLTGTTDNGSFRADFKRCSREPAQWKEELYAAAREIAKQSHKPLWLCASGGTESEIMCRAFFDQGIQFSVITVDFRDQGLQRDVEYIKRWCFERGVPHRVTPLHIEQFFKEDIRRYIDDGVTAKNTFRFFQIRLMEIVRDLGGHAVIGDGSPLYNTRDKTVYIDFLSGEMMPITWCDAHSEVHFPFFFRTTSELWLSFLTMPVVTKALEYPELFVPIGNSKLFKRMLHASAWPEVKVRPRSAMFGNSNLRLQIEHELEKELGERVQRYGVPVTEALKALKPV